jgi:hypothetical protein
MVAAPRIISHVKLFSGAFFTSRFSLVEGEADAEWEETDEGTAQSWRGRDPSTYTRIVEITSGKAISQQGLAATCKDLLTKRKLKETGGSWSDA